MAGPTTQIVRIVVRSTTSREETRLSGVGAPILHGAHRATLECEGPGGSVDLGRTRRYDTWAQAAHAALRLADRRGHCVVDRAVVECRIAREGGAARSSP